MPHAVFRLPLLGALLCLVSCQSPHSDEEPVPEHGLGLLNADASPPPNSASFDAPTLGSGQQLAVGNELIYRRGGKHLAHFRVEAGAEGGWNLIDVGTGVSLRYDSQWLDLGKDLPDDSGPLLILDPGDPLLHFPLWAGKKWSAHFISRAGRRAPIALEVNYSCDAQEWVTTPAGRFHCFRIWRSAQLAGPIESYSEEQIASAEAPPARQRMSLYWYSPELGFVVKRIDDSELLELIEIRR